MKKLVLGLFLAFAALGFLVSPAVAETKESQKAPALSAADRAFLASLAGMPMAPAPAAKKPGEDPPIGENALCTASASCGSYTIACEGNTSCSAADRNCDGGERGHVTCDGNTTWCNEECPGCPLGWCDGEYDCYTGCFPCPYSYTCNETFCTDRCRCNFQNCSP